MPLKIKSTISLKKQTDRAQLYNVKEREIQKQQHRPVAESAAHC